MADSPAADATPAQANGLDIEQSELLEGEEEAVLDPSPEDLGLVLDETSDAGGKAPQKVNGGDGHDEEEAVETNGVDHEELVMEEDEPPETPEKKSKSGSRSPGTATSQRSKGKQPDHHSKNPQSVSRKALVEKIHMVIPAEPGSATRDGKKNGDTNDIDIDADADGDEDIDAEYEVDGDMVMET